MKTVKILVETNGDYDVLDLNGQQVVHSYRPCVVTLTPYIDACLGGTLRRIEVLTDDADDAALSRCKTEEELFAAITALPRPEVKAKPRPAKKD